MLLKPFKIFTPVSMHPGVDLIALQRGRHSHRTAAEREKDWLSLELHPG